MSTEQKTLADVENFWDANLCGGHFIDKPYLSLEFYEEYKAFRYAKEHHLMTYIDWSQAKGKDVLEIGLGVGADSTQWAQHAASFTGVDLTNEAVQATRKHFELLGLEGNIIQGNAEELPFEDNTFDLIYSHGVLHHTTNIENTFRAIGRTLKDDGQVIMMLYSKGSFNYWFRIQFYFRLRVILAWMLSKLGVKASAPWSEHLDNMKERGRSYLSWSNFPHHCTDGPGCEIANIYYVPEVRKRLEAAGFTLERTVKAHFPFSNGKFPRLERAVARSMGFYQFFWAVKK